MCLHAGRFHVQCVDPEGVCVCLQELRDRNDELSSELEVLKGHRSDRKSRRSTGVTRTAGASLNWTDQHSVSTESDSGNTTTPLLVSQHAGWVGV